MEPVTSRNAARINGSAELSHSVIGRGSVRIAEPPLCADSTVLVSALLPHMNGQSMPVHDVAKLGGIT